MSKLMSIVTKTGDQGQTSLYDGSRVPKDAPPIEEVGLLDELNASLGVVRSMGGDESAPELHRIQCELFDLGTLVAMPGSDGSMEQALKELEFRTAELEAGLPALKNFILPGGHPLAAQVHLARTICRRAEREFVKLAPQPKQGLPYLNRLSDYLFLLARKVNLDRKTEEVIWKNP